MIESFKKTLLAGLGAAVVTREKVQEGLQEFVKQGKISAADARAMAEKVAAEGRREFEDVSAKLGERAREFMAGFDSKYLTRIELLEARVDALERKLGVKSPKPRSERLRDPRVNQSGSGIGIPCPPGEVLEQAMLPPWATTISRAIARGRFRPPASTAPGTR